MECEQALIVSDSPNIDRAHALGYVVKIDALLVRVGRQLLAQFGDELVPRIPVLKKLEGFHDAGVINRESVHKNGQVLTPRKIHLLNYIFAAR